MHDRPATAATTNPPAVPQVRSPEQLAPFTGSYTTQVVVFDGSTIEDTVRFGPFQGRLRTLNPDGTPEDAFTLAFYRDNSVVPVDDKGTVADSRSDFIVAPDGSVQWYRRGGRLYPKCA